VLVTGGSLGIGLEVSRALAHRGASVIVAARGREAIDAAVASLEGSGHAGLVLDVSDSHAWAGADETVGSGGALHGLVAAAGVLGPIGRLDDVSAAEVIDTIAVNLIGTILALHHCLPRLRATGGRAVTFSGGGGTAPLPRYDSYAASKAGVARVTENVAAAGEVEVNCVAPGFVATRMHEGTLRAGPEASGRDYFERTRTQLEAGGFPAAEAAELVCFLLSEQARGISGRLLSAQWDPWREPEFLARLRADPALATLRRIDDHLFTRAAGS
jgi:NAD(P)-dependent dehydrogenase (short-subunit alcohol dehydrogenase family)